MDYTSCFKKKYFFLEILLIGFSGSTQCYAACSKHSIFKYTRLCSPHLFRTKKIFLSKLLNLYILRNLSFSWPIFNKFCLPFTTQFWVVLLLWDFTADNLNCN